MGTDVETLHRNIRRGDLLRTRTRILERMERRVRTARGAPRDDRDDLDRQLSMLAGYWDDVNAQLDALDGTDGSGRRAGADVVAELKQAR